MHGQQDYIEMHGQQDYTEMHGQQDYTEMHGQQNIKICDAKKAKQVHQYKNPKIKFYKNNAGAPDGHLQSVTIPDAI